jgi:putative membrane protein
MQVRKVVIGVTVAIVVLVLVAVVVGALLWGRAPYGYGPGMMGGYRLPFGMHTFGGGSLMVLFGVAILAGLGLLVGYLARNGQTPAGKTETPLAILKRRYASGEIDREEFERIKESLLS